MTLHAQTSPGSWIAVLRGSHDRLAGLSRPLTEEQLTAQSYDSEWSIAQVLSHLGSGAEIFGLFLAAARDGGEQPARDDFLAIWDRWNAKSPLEQGTDAIVADAALVAGLEALDEGQLASIRLTLLGRETDVTGLVRMRLSEHAIHTWDVEVALDPTATVLAEAVELLVDTVDQTIQFAGKPSGLQATVRVRTTDPERDLALTIGEAVTIAPWSGGEATAELSAPAEALLRLITGRLDAEHTPPLTISGVELSDLRKTFPGF